MNTKASNKGLVVLPSSLRRRLGIRAGDSLGVEVEAGRIVLTPRRRRRLPARILTDPKTGLPGLGVGPGVPVLSRKQVAEILQRA